MNSRSVSGSGSMDAAHWSRLKDAFAALSDLTPPQRDAELATLAARDPALAGRLAGLLEADARADAVLQRFELAPVQHEPAGSDAPIAEPNAIDSALVSDPFGYFGRTVSHYRVHEVLGIGGMGVVYRAEDTKLGRDVALKFLLPQYSLDPTAKERFLHEARAASALDHPNVCTVYGVGTSDAGHLFLAMACYEGETLKARLARSPLAIPDALDIVEQILMGLSAAHAAGIVHRDLKPGNVMLLPDGRVKILDFGLAKMSDLSLTGPGLRPGTVAYMSPEQVEGKPLDLRTDLWSLGVLLYESICGRRPFGGGHDLSTVYAILNEEPDPPSRTRPELAAVYDTIVHRLLRKDPGERYASAVDVMADLTAARDGEPLTESQWQSGSGDGVPAAPVTQRGRRGPIVMATALTAVVLAIGYASLPDRGGTGIPREGDAARAANARAHELYLQGRFHWNRRSPGDLDRAIQYFEQAAQTDTTYAQAYAGLALANASLPISGGATAVEVALRKAEHAAARAIALDPSNAEAHAALGYAYHWQWRWADAERMLKRATELDSVNTLARQWYGEHLAKMGRGREAEAELRRAVILDSLSPIAHANLALVLMLDGRLDEAIAESERTSRMDPSFPVPWLLLHRLYLLSGRVEESANAGRRAAELRGLSNADDFVVLAHGTRSAADRAAALAVLDRWTDASPSPWAEIGMYAAIFGQRDRAIEALDRAVQTRSVTVAGLNVAPWLASLRGDPRFEELRRRVGLP
ncbi:MAG TPA: serine/threonine-protein kinase [Gemmatimonadaceae bacterium]|nr:serine/threonine-protein kinase [Gemmatimonadaceae bacterium]